MIGYKTQAPANYPKPKSKFTKSVAAFIDKIMYWITKPR